MYALDSPTYQGILQLGCRGHRIVIDATTRSEMFDLINTAIALHSRDAEATQSAHISHFLHAHSPPYGLARPLSPPIFSRNDAPGSGSRTFHASHCVANDMEELSSMLAPAIDPNVGQDDLAFADRYKQDMAIINGQGQLTIFRASSRLIRYTQGLSIYPCRLHLHWSLWLKMIERPSLSNG